MCVLNANLHNLLTTAGRPNDPRFEDGYRAWALALRDASAAGAPASSSARSFASSTPALPYDTRRSAVRTSASPL